MKKCKLLILLSFSFLIFFSGTTLKPYQKYITKDEFIKNLIKTMKIQIYYFKAPKASEYFKDVKENNPYAMDLIMAFDAGILSTDNGKVYPKNYVKIVEAKDFINNAYLFKTKKNEDIFLKIISKLKTKTEYKNINDNTLITYKMSQDIMNLLKDMIANNNKNYTCPKDLKVYKSMEKDFLNITLDWGEKPTGGYIIKITKAEEKGNDIIVYFNYRSPKKGEMVTQVITHPKDSIKIKVKDKNKDYNIILKGTAL